MAVTVVDSSRFNAVRPAGVRRRAMAVVAGFLVTTAACQQPPADRREALVFAAASLQTVIDTLGVRAREATGISLRPSYAASSALARQIEQGAPADLIISADPAWLDYLDARQRLRPGSRVALAGNRLVLIAPRGRPVALTIAPNFPLAHAVGHDRLALADPDVVPAGTYARAALTRLGVWDGVAARIAPAANVRAVLQRVALGETPLGIVYETDARAEPDVRVVDRFPESTHPPIVYAAALTSNASPDASALLAFLQGAAARAIFDSQGFTPAP
jgi:molybdate transport system substrate-binding protein